MRIDDDDAATKEEKSGTKTMAMKPVDYIITLSEKRAQELSLLHAILILINGQQPQFLLAQNHNESRLIFSLV